MKARTRLGRCPRAQNCSDEPLPSATRRNAPQIKYANSQQLLRQCLPIIERVFYAGRMARTPRDQRPFNVRYYAQHRWREIERVRRRQMAALAFLRDMRRVPCLDCRGAFEPYQMDFDHRDRTTKSFRLTEGRALLKSRAELLQELAKCDVVCANCHAIRTYAQEMEKRERRRSSGQYIATSRREAQRRRELEVRALLLDIRERPCADCRRRYPPYVMEFDHREPGEKQFLVAHSWTRSRLQILEEAKKCDIVCRNCHRTRTYQRRIAGVIQRSECLPSKEDVTGSSPVTRSEPPDQVRLIEEKTAVSVHPLSPLIRAGSDPAPNNH
jgi:hypothetical protein